VTITINEQDINTFITIHDEKELQALPTGAALIEHDAYENGYESDDCTIYKTPNGTFTYEADQIEDEDYRGFSNIHLPAVLVNPEILGEFHTMPAASETVEITHSPTGIGQNFTGLRAVVEEDPYTGREGKVWLKPLTSRPDGFGLWGFYWPVEGVRVVPPCPFGLKVNDRVTHKNIPGSEGVIVRLFATEREHLVRWEDNGIGTCGAFPENLEKVVEFPDEEPLADWERELLEGDLDEPALVLPVGTVLEVTAEGLTVIASV
jgi:hypothetical protein